MLIVSMRRLDLPDESAIRRFRAQKQSFLAHVALILLFRVFLQASLRKDLMSMD